MVKPTLRTSTSLLHALRWSIQRSTSLVHVLRWSKRTLESSTSILQHALRWSKRTLRSSTNSTPFAVAKTHSPKWTNSRSLLHALRWPKALPKPVLASYMLYGGQNAVSKVVQWISIAFENGRQFIHISWSTLT